uniref:STI1 domain-containing protein n=1 Tax=Guillardia theta TaxID=55529 RepID=A0A7S4NTQ4_GUITH|mmetsp:Transcript_33561/g.105684  ORF Transcript_33561/g.105684 Transcript_33561/m.105684 type:complete len:570 (+) Transcript_33561:29-1738(+)
MSAEELKAKGNAAFSAKNYTEAVDFFTQAINLDPNNHVLFSNRSASYAGLHKYDQALNDAEKCIAIKPDWGKGYGRKGAAMHGMGDFEGALKAYKDGLAHEPGLAMLTNGISEVEAAMRAEQSSGIKGIGNLLRRPDLVEIIARSPQLAPFLAQPDFPGIVQELQTDSNALMKHLNDQRVQLLLQELLRMQNPDVFRHAEEEEIKRRKAKEEAEEAERKRQLEEKKRKEAEEAARKAAMTENDFKDNPKGLSEWCKEKGNTFYKNKQFDEAITWYTKAYEADNENIAVLTNRAAVRFEQKMYEECIEDCRKAIEEGRKCRADFKIISRAYERLGNAFVKLDRLQEASKAYSDALVENRTREVEKKLKDVQKQIADSEKNAYINPEISLQEKEKGNALVKESKFVEAKAAYDEAIRRNPKDHTLYSNRALCFMKLMEWPAAKADCDKSLEIEPNFVRALERRGNCYMMLKEPTKAMADFRKGLELDPNNQGCQIGLARVESSMFSGKRDEQTVANAMKDPEIQRILQDPVINNVLRNLQENPSAAQDALKDPVIAERIQKLAAAGILSFG